MERLPWLNGLLAEYRIPNNYRKFKVPRPVLAERLNIFGINESTLVGLSLKKIHGGGVERANPRWWCGVIRAQQELAWGHANRNRPGTGLADETFLRGGKSGFRNIVFFRIGANF